jgi:membrane protein DedA with SNARE-associated domain
MLCVGVLGLVEATVIACLYLPGTAILLVLLLGLQPTGATALSLLAALNVGTALGYGASWVMGRAVHSHLLRFMGESYVTKVDAAIERYGLASLLVLAAHPNNLAVAFSVLGATSGAGAIRYFIVALVIQNIWWIGFWSVAELFSQQQIVTRSNFYLYLAALFALWLAYELIVRKARPPTRRP